jgi:TonB family protein
VIADILEALLKANLVIAIGVAIVLVARPHVMKHLGARAAYLCWTLVPALLLAILIPSRAIEVAAPAVQLPTGMEDLGVTSPHHVLPAGWLAMVAIPVLLVWIGGAIAMGVFLALRQRRFLADMSLGLAGPAVVGFLQQYIVTPDDFARRYSSAEQKLILAHEEVHLERNDARINAFAALARCLCWFNPLVHLGAHAMRIDQELSCDAAVIEQRPKARRAYAETLLKTQLASRPLPVGCYWPAPINANGAVHPLTERIDMLTRKPFSQRRRILATITILSLACTAGAAAWAAQPERKISSTIALPPIVEGEAAEVLLPLQLPASPQHASSRTDIRLTPDEPAPPAPDMDTRPTLHPDTPVPDYPAESLRLREEGTVTMDLCISRTGAVESAKLLKSSGYPALDEAALKWMSKLAVSPATRDGKPIAVCNYPLAYQWSLKHLPPQSPQG